MKRHCRAADGAQSHNPETQAAWKQFVEAVEMGNQPDRPLELSMRDKTVSI